ncbi:MAG: phosphatase PAP2 family protein [Clostridiaceae bacterium]
MLEFFKGIDMKLLDHVNEKFKYEFLDSAMPRITALGNGGIVWIIISLILISNESGKKLGFMVIFALILTAIIGEGAIKHIIKRTRPFVHDLEKKLLIVKPITYSFPSGHTSSSFAAAGIFFSVHSKFTLFAVVLAALIAFSRVYLNVHYPTDVFMGIILGLICSQIVVAAYNSGFADNLNTIFKQLVNS